MKITKRLTYVTAILLLASFSTSIEAAAQTPSEKSYYINEGKSSSTKYNKTNIKDPSYGKTVRVRYGDTLWSIARSHRYKGTTTKQIMLATLALNPKAFAQENVNGLMKNMTLQMPNYQQARRMTAGSADVEVARQNRVWARYQGKPVTSKKSSWSSSWFDSKSSSKSSSKSQSSIAEQLAQAQKNERKLKNQLAKMEKLLKQKDLTIKRMRSGGKADAKSALFKGIDGYTPKSGEALKSNLPWLVLGGFILFVIFMLLRWKRRRNKPSGPKGANTKKQQKAKQKQERRAAKLDAKNAKQAEKEAAKQAKIDAQKAKEQVKAVAKQAKLDKKQSAQEAKTKLAPVVTGLETTQAEAMKQLEKDFNLPPSEDLSIDAVLDTRLETKKSQPEVSGIDDWEEDDIFSEFDDMELDFSLDDELERETSKKLVSRTDIPAQSQEIASVATLAKKEQPKETKNEVVAEPIQSEEFDEEEFLSFDDELLDDGQLSAIEADMKMASLQEPSLTEIDADELEEIIFSSSELQNVKKSAIENQFGELKDLTSAEAQQIEIKKPAKDEIDFSELTDLDNTQLDFENISTDADFLSEEEADKLEAEFLDTAAAELNADELSFGDNLSLDDIAQTSEDLNAKLDFTGEQNTEKSFVEKNQISDFKDFNDLLKEAIANPELATIDENSPLFFNNQSDIFGESDTNNDPLDANSALEALGGFDALGDIYNFTYNNEERKFTIVDEREAQAWKILREEEREEEKLQNKIGGLELNSQKIEFENFYDTPQLHRLEELLHKKEVEQFEDYFAFEDDNENIKLDENLVEDNLYTAKSEEEKSQDFLLDLDDFSEVPEFKEIEELDLDGLDFAIDMAEEEIADADELEHILQDADPLEYESYFDHENRVNNPALAAQQILEDPSLAEFSEFQAPAEQDKDEFTADDFMLDDSNLVQKQESNAEDSAIADLSAYADVIDMQSPLLEDSEQAEQKLENIASEVEVEKMPEQILAMEEVFNNDLDGLDLSELNLDEDLGDDIEFTDDELELESLDDLLDEQMPEHVNDANFNDELAEDLDEQLLQDISSFIENSKSKDEEPEDKLFIKHMSSEADLDSYNFDTKLNLAAAYIAIGDFSEAADILHLVAQKGNSEQQAKAVELSDRNQLQI